MHPPGRLQVTALIALAAISFAACGSDSDDGDSPATSVTEATPADASPADANGTGTVTPDGRDGSGPCSLLTDEEGNQLLGVTATSVEESVTGPFVACQWINDASLPIELLQIGTFDFDVDPDFFRETASASDTGTLEEVAGLGDEALWDGIQLFIRRGELMISVIPSNSGGREQAIAAAELALPRLD